MFRSGLFASLIVAGVGMTNPSFAQSTVYIPAILELSGAGAVSGTNFRDGMLLAIDEINAKGGILGRKIETPLLDTQSDAGISRAQVQKVLDNKPFVILGPVFSGSVLVDMLLTQQAEIPEIVGGEAAAITQKGNPYVFRTSFGQQFSMVQEVFAILKSLRDNGVTILLIEQNAKQALQISDYGLVLEQGQTRIEDTAANILADPRIAQLFLGGGLAQPERVA